MKELNLQKIEPNACVLTTFLFLKHILKTVSMTRDIVGSRTFYSDIYGKNQIILIITSNNICKHLYALTIVSSSMRFSCHCKQNLLKYIFIEYFAHFLEVSFKAVSIISKRLLDSTLEYFIPQSSS